LICRSVLLVGGCLGNTGACVLPCRCLIIPGLRYLYRRRSSQYQAPMVPLFRLRSLLEAYITPVSPTQAYSTQALVMPHLAWQ